MLIALFDNVCKDPGKGLFSNGHRAMLIALFDKVPGKGFSSNGHKAMLITLFD